MKNILYLTLKKPQFEVTLSGEKKLSIGGIRSGFHLD